MYKFKAESKRLVVYGKNLGRVASFVDGLFETDNEAKGKYLIENAKELKLEVLGKPVVVEVVEEKPVEPKKTLKK
jgi:hypothetical protein